MPPNVFINHAAGDILPAADWSSNWSLVEASFDVIGPFIQTGLIPTAGSGLAVNVSSGNALIDANIAKSGSWSITSLANNTVNHLYLLQNGTGTSNTTGSAPAASVKLGTATTAGGVVTSVNTLRSSGRQVFVRPENQVPGAAGSMGSINLASWAAAAADNVPVFGVLPAGAVPATPAPLTLTVTDAGTGNEPSILSLAHRTSATPGASFGSAFLMQADNAANTLTDQLVINAGWSSATAGAENALVLIGIRKGGADTELVRLNTSGNGRLQATQDFFHAGTNLGFYGTTPIAKPGATTDLKTVLTSVGLIAAGSATPLNLEGGTFACSTISDTLTDSGTSIESDMILLTHHSSGTPAAGFGTALEFGGDDNANVNRKMGRLTATWLDPSTALSISQVTLKAAKGAAFVTSLIADGNQLVTLPGTLLVSGASTLQAVTLTGDLTLSTHNLITDTTTGTKIGTGTTQKLGFFNSTPIVQPANTTDLRTALINLGLYATGGATPLDLNGGAFTTGRINNAGQYGGSGAPCQFKRFSLTFPSDADYTLATNEKDAYWIDVQTGVITATRNIIVPVQAQMIYLIQNRNTQAVTLKTSGGTGITVAAGRCAWVGSSNGTNMSRLSPDVDFTV